MTDFFNSHDVKEAINNYANFINNITVNSGFEREKNRNLVTILKHMNEHSEEWNENTQYTINSVAVDFIREFANKSNQVGEIDFIFSTVFRFLMELSFNQKDNLSAELDEFKFFTIRNKAQFSDKAKKIIEYSLSCLPFDLIRNEYHNDDIQYFKKAAKAERLMKERIDGWDLRLEEKIEKAEALKSKLDEQETAYNFVGLYHGYNTLSKDKRSELNRAFIFTFSLAFLVLLPFSVSVFLVYKEMIKFDSIISSLNLLPFFTLTFIFIYYFRISLVNYISIKAQVNQIELRKTLCSFIQKYSEYAKEMKANDGTSLEKFESIIFSNIMPSEDKIPSTFDGIEQIAKLIESIKK
ncbi:hypothetical protein [Pectobacterium zantedeschiae]|uniref:Uncharacterized protein n=1 Tax=Pectobacterium zantedeschiae TaxID=2034769 RepID=A0A9X8P3B5_9GAMM|nr:hypothetical protein [Pectobacterium zantedeschiae]RYC38887.1 hypothetical protein CLR69_21795 [Pectobacterium zantedeschiae]